MPLFQEEEIVYQDKHKQLDLKELQIGESIAFNFQNTREAKSTEYGDFIVCQGLKVDITCESIDAFIASATPASFIPNTLLLNKIETGEMLPGEVYRIEKAWNRFQKFADNKTAKGWGYKVFHVDVGPQVREQLKERYKALINPLETSETDQTPETPVNDAPKRPAV